MRSLLSPLRYQFLKKWLKTSISTFVLLWLFFSWAFQASSNSSALWASLFTVFLCGGGTYLRWSDGLSDDEILKLAEESSRG